MVVNFSTNKFKVFAALLMSVVFLTTNQASSQSAEFLQLLSSNKNTLVINRLSFDDRSDFFKTARIHLKGEYQASLLNLLCEVEPWSTGDTEEDEVFQSEIYDLVNSTFSPRTKKFEIIDCAAANRIGSFYSVMPKLNREMKEAYLSGTGEAWAKKSAPSSLSKIRSVDSDLINLLVRKPVRSYFPLVNVQRKAQILSAQAVQLAPNDEIASKELLKEASRVFQEWGQGNKPFEVVRQNWTAC